MLGTYVSDGSGPTWVIHRTQLYIYTVCQLCISKKISRNEPVLAACLQHLPDKLGGSKITYPLVGACIW